MSRKDGWQRMQRVARDRLLDLPLGSATGGFREEAPGRRPGRTPRYDWLRPWRTARGELRFAVSRGDREQDARKAVVDC